MRTLGATGLPVSALGLGLAALGRPGYINLGHAGDVGDTHVEAMERHAHEVLDAAYEGGVRYFDAARSYGRAEAFLGSWLRRRGLSRDDVTVGSKWGYTYTADWRVDVDEHEVKDLTVSTLRCQLGETRALIGEHLALYQIHSATIESGVLDDAARSYGRAEAFLSSWLRRRGFTHDDVTVGSKWGYTYTADWRVDVDEHEVKDLSVSTLRRQLGETRALIGEHLALYQIHSATLESGVLDDAEIREELARLREEGVRVGFTATGPRQAATIERALEVGGFDAVQATWNVHERAATDALAAAHEAGLGVIVKEALANGRLTERGDADGRLTAAARERGTTPDALALAAVLARPWVDVVLSGAATVDTVRSNLAALEAQWDARAEEELAALEEPADEYWERRSELAWN